MVLMRDISLEQISVGFIYYHFSQWDFVNFVELLQRLLGLRLVRRKVQMVKKMMNVKKMMKMMKKMMTNMKMATTRRIHQSRCWRWRQLGLPDFFAWHLAGSSWQGL